MTLRVLIADDERPARQRLRQLLRAETDLEIIGECATGPETVSAILKEAPDLVLLDVRMPELDGFEVIQAVGAERLPAIIFVTAYDEFALRAFEAQAADYLLKPFERARFQKALQRGREKALRRKSGGAPPALEELLSLVGKLTAPSPAPERFAIRSGGRIVLVRPEEIEWIRSADNYSELHVGKAVHLLRQGLGSLEQQLPPRQFVRISRSLIVNVDQIREVRPKLHGDCLVILRDGKELPASRNFRGELLKRLGKPSA